MFVNSKKERKPFRKNFHKKFRKPFSVECELVKVTNENGEEINSDSDANLVTSMLSTIGNAIEDIVIDAYRAYTYTVKFGSFEVFPDMLITNCKNFT